jgi:outer membrane protein
MHSKQIILFFNDHGKKAVPAQMKTFATSFLLIVILGSSAQAADLLDIFKSAQRDDPVIAAARATQLAVHEKLPQGRALSLPAVSLVANSAINDVTTRFAGSAPPIFQGGTSRYNTNGYGITLVQPLIRPQNQLVYSEAQQQVIQSDAQFKIAEQDLLLRCAVAYFDVLIAQNSVQLNRAQKSAISEQLAQAKRNFEVGNATITDTNEAQARHDLTYAQEIAAQNNLEIKLGALQQLTHTETDNLKPLGSHFKLDSPVPADMEKWLIEAQLNSPQLIIAQASVQLAKKEVSKMRDAHYPTLDLIASYSTSNAGSSMYGVGVDSINKSIGVQLNIPIYQGGATNSKWREAEHNHERALQELENARRNVAQQTRQAYLGVVSGIAQVKALQQALTSSESVLASSRLGEEVGVRTNLDVLNAQQQLYSTRRDLYQAEYDFLLSQLKLKAATGSLNEEDLLKINQMLN